MKEDIVKLVGNKLDELKVYIFDVIEEGDEDKNNLKNDNLKGDLVNNIL